MAEALPTEFSHEHAGFLVDLLEGTTDSQKQGTSARLLELAEGVPGFCTLLLDLATADPPVIRDGLRLAAMISVKNAIRRHWSEGRSANSTARVPGIVHPEERLRIRQRLLHTCFTEPHGRVAGQVTPALTRIARSGYPTEWPDLFGELWSTIRATCNCDGVPLALERACFLQYKIIQEIASKTLGSDRRRFSSLSAELLPDLTALWDQLFTRLRADMDLAFSKHVDQTLMDLRVAEPLMSVCRHVLKTIEKLTDSSPHSVLLQPAIAAFWVNMGPCLSFCGEKYSQYCTLIKQLQASRSSGGTIGLCVDCGEDEDQDGMQGFTEVPGGQLWFKLLTRSAKVVLACIKAHPLALAASTATRSISMAYFEWVRSSSRGELQLADTILQHALAFLSQLLDGAQRIARSMGTETNSPGVMDELEEVKRLATNSDPRAETAHRETAAIELLELHHVLFQPESHDDWLAFCVQSKFQLTQQDLQNLAKDAPTWIFNQEDCSQGDTGCRGAAQALLLTLVNDDTHAVTMCSKLVQYAHSTVQTLVDAASSLCKAEGSASAVFAAALLVDASHLAVGVCSADAVARGVLSEDGYESWLCTSLLPVMYLCGLREALSSITAASPVLQNAIAALPDTSSSDQFTAKTSTLSQLLCWRMFWLLSCSRSVMNQTWRISMLHFGCTVMAGVEAGPGIKLAASFMCNSLIDEWPFGTEPMASVETLEALSQATFSCACDVSASYDQQQRVLGVMSSALQRAPPSTVVGAAESLFSPLQLLWSGEAAYGGASSLGMGGSLNGGLSFIRRYVVSTLVSIVSSIPFCPEDSVVIPVTFWRACLPIVSHCLDHRNADEVYLCPHGLELWITVLETCPDEFFRSDEVYEPVPLLVSLVMRDVEHSSQAANVINALISRAHEHLDKLGVTPMLASTLERLISISSARSAAHVYAALETVSIVCTDSSLVFKQCWTKLLVSIVKGVALKLAAEVEDDQAVSAHRSLNRAFNKGAAGSHTVDILREEAGPSAADIAHSAHGESGGDEIPAQSDPLLVTHGCAVLARTFLNDEEAFCGMLGEAFQAHAGVLLGCQALPANIEAVWVSHPEAAGSIGSLALLVWCLDNWLDQLVDVAASPAAAFATGFSMSQLHNIAAIMRNKLFAMSCLRAVNTCMALHTAILPGLQAVEALALLYSPAIHALHPEAMRVDPLFTYAADTIDAWDAVVLSQGDNSLANTIAMYVPCITDIPAKRKFNSHYRRHLSTMQSVATSLFSGVSTVQRSGGNELQKALQIAQESRSKFASDDADEPEEDTDSVNDSGVDPVADVSATIASRHAEYTAARQRIFQMRAESQLGLREFMLEQLNNLRECVGPELWEEGVASKLPAVTIAKLTGQTT